MQYDQPLTQDQVNELLTNNQGLAPETTQAIENILGTAPGGSDPEWNVGIFDGTNIQAPVDQPVQLLIIAPPPPPVPGQLVQIQIPTEVMQQASAYVFQTNENLQVVFNTVERVIVSGNGNDEITVNGDKNTTLDGSGGNDTLLTSGGNDSVSGGDGNDSVSTAAGNDTIVSGIGDDTIDGGTGRDVVELIGNKDDYTVTLVDGELRVTNNANTSVEAKLSNVEFVSFADDGSVAVARSEDEATVLRLYQGILGRDADNAGAEYWLNELNTGINTQVGIAGGFLASTELNADGPVSDVQFIETLYQHALGRSAEDAGMEYWLNDLNNGRSRAEVAISIVGSPEAAEDTSSVIVITGQV